jgi:hypothetical protein
VIPLGVVARRVRDDEVLDRVERHPSPWDEVIDLGPSSSCQDPDRGFTVVFAVSAAAFLVSAVMGYFRASDCSERVARGYAVLQFAHAGLIWWPVSDASPADVRELQRLLSAFD